VIPSSKYMKFSSKLLEEVMLAFHSLPGVGKKSALRMALHVMKKDHEYSKKFSEAIWNARNQIKTCIQCFNFSDDELCSICTNPRRDTKTICVVESTRDVMAIEETNQYQGLYHVLGGVLSPIDGIGPAQLQISPLINRLGTGNIKELIMAINPTIEGETTIYYLTKLIQSFPIQVSVIARGVSFGGELEYADEMTLGRSILARTPYQLKIGSG